MATGEIAALTAALLWTISSMFWRELRLSAWTINLAKNLVGVLLLGTHLVVSATIAQTPIFHASPTSIGYLAFSGLIGVVIGDTLYFRCLQILGPRRALMIATTSPLFAVALGWIFSGQQLIASALAGVFLTVTGVITVLADRRAGVESPTLFPGKDSVGMACGIGGALCQAIGGVLSQRGMSDCSGLESSFYRVAVAALSMTLLYFVSGHLWKSLKTAFEKPLLKILIPATIIGTWLGIWFSQISYKHADVAIAQTLLSTCPLFAIPIVYFVDRQKISALSVVGSVVAIAGVYLIAS